MAWIELHQSVVTHRKTLAFADALDIEPVLALGHLASLWLWALDNVPGGSLAEVSDRTLARAGQWAGPAADFRAALMTAEYIDADQAIHDWHGYAGKLIDRREANAEKQRQWRNRHQPSIDERRNGDVPSHVTVTRNQSERLRTAATVPNPTVPNPTSKESPTTAVDRVAPMAADAAPDAPPGDSSTALVAVVRARDPLFDALQTVFPKGPRTDAERGKWNTAAFQLRKGKVAPEEVLRAAENWPNVMSGATMTPMGIASNLGLLLDGPQVNGRSNGVTHSLQQTLRQNATLPPDDMALMRAAKAARRPH